MRDQRDRPGRQHVAFDVAGRAQPVRDVDEAHAPGAAQRHAGVDRDVAQRRPQRRRRARCRRSPPSAHRAAAASRSCSLERVHRRRRAGRGRPARPECFERRQARPAVDRVVARVDQVQIARDAGAAADLGDHPRAEAARPRARPDERDRARPQHRRTAAARSRSAARQCGAQPARGRASGPSAPLGPPASRGCRTRRRRRASPSWRCRGRRSACGSRRSPGAGRMWNSCSSDSSPWKMLPPIRPYSCSISCGPTMSRCMIDDLKFGATAS